jgi:hypothetical protein
MNYLLTCLLLVTTMPFFAQSQPKGTDAEQILKIIEESKGMSVEQLEQFVKSKKIATPSPSPAKPGKEVLKEVHSVIDLKCLQNKYEQQEYEVDKKTLQKWLDECRTPKLSNKCTVLEQKSNAVCKLRIQRYYPYELPDDLASQVEQQCRDINAKCVEKASQESD